VPEFSQSILAPDFNRLSMPLISKRSDSIRTMPPSSPTIRRDVIQSLALEKFRISQAPLEMRDINANLCEIDLSPGG